VSRREALDKAFFIFFKFLCRVPPNLAPGKDFFIFFLISLPGAA
jgi:hypothetical protein